MAEVLGQRRAGAGGDPFGDRNELSSFPLL